MDLFTTNYGGPLANRVCGQFFVAFRLVDANTRSAKHNPHHITKLSKLIYLRSFNNINNSLSSTPPCLTNQYLLQH
jgi:hypothetical protein